MSNYLRWSLKRLVNAICDRLLNKFDVFMVIEGNRGLGKSTLAVKIMLLVKREMKRREVEGYKFTYNKCLLYTKKEVKQFFHKRKLSGIADEMINVTFNRDFYNEDQKDIIKMINMNRDHNNLFIACVPQFKNLDSQIKNLTSMKITIVRRGIGVIHRPNKTIYSADIWDERYNEKIEREWLKKKVKNPQYSRLTTFRGFVHFPKLTDKQEAKYQEVKDRKRNIIAQDKGLEENEEDKDPFKIIYDALVEGKVKNTSMLEGMIIAQGLKTESTKNKLRRTLKENHKPSSIVSYYYDSKKVKKEVAKERKKSDMSELIAKAREKLS